MSILTSLQLLPLFGALVVGFLPASNAKLVKQVALAFSLLSDSGFNCYGAKF
jgi:NADH:ubiquinone oxidoreductase subunit 4 (subunit M)